MAGGSTIRNIAAALRTAIVEQRIDLAARPGETHWQTVSRTQGNSFDSRAGMLGTIDRAAATTVPAEETWVIAEG
jgi:hypothetical protein